MNIAKLELILLLILIPFIIITIFLQTVEPPVPLSNNCGQNICHNITLINKLIENSI